MIEQNCVCGKVLLSIEDKSHLPDGDELTCRHCGQVYVKKPKRNIREGKPAYSLKEA
jgi:hypothetical protein